MGKIFCIMGKSSTGKDTLFVELMKEKKLQLNKIIPYTTRPIRKGEQEGVEYHFVDEAKLQELIKQNKVIEVRSYQTVAGIWNYFTVYDEGIDLQNHNYLIIGTLESFCKFKEFFGEEKVLPLYIEVEDSQRLQRALDRENKQQQPSYEEMCRRFIADNQDFSKEKLEQAKIVEYFINEHLDETKQQIGIYIKKHL